MINISTTQARKDFSTLVNRVAFGKDRILLSRHGEKLAAIVPLEDIKLLERVEDYIDAEEADKILKRIENGEEETISFEELKKEPGL